MKRWMKILLGVVGCLALLALGAYVFYLTEKTSHSAPKGPPAAIVPTDDPIVASIRRGIEYLKTVQEEDGNFSLGRLDPKPAITALVVDALARCPEKYREDTAPFFAHAVKAIVARQQTDGSICTPSLGLQNYCTSISIMALKAVENPAYQDALDRAKKYLLGIQDQSGPEEANSGGFGYSAGGRPDLSNVQQTLEALREMGVPADDPAYERVKQFISRCQNNSETNDQAWAGNDGGFIYRATDDKSKAGYEEGRDGRRIPKSYGLMSYAGLKSFLYAYAKKDDPRVRSAFRWVQDNYTLEENRNLGPKGLYYYYYTMAKALKVYGQKVIECSDGSKHEWAKEIAEKLVSLQRADGSWVNQDPTWEEKDSVLVTAYCIRTLSVCYEELHAAPVKETREDAPGGSK